MRWPDIFFKSRTPQHDEEPVVIPKDTPPSIVKPVPVTSAPSSTAFAPTTKTEELKARQLAIPGTGGTVLRVPSRASTPQAVASPALVEPTANTNPSPPVKSVADAMAEADTLRTLTRSGGVRLIRHVADDPIPEPSPTAPLASPGVTIFRRKTKMTDVARIVLPSTREETASPAPSASVLPPLPVTVSAAATSLPSAEIPPIIPNPPAVPTSTSEPIPQGEKSPIPEKIEIPQPDSIPLATEMEKKSAMPASDLAPEEKPVAPSPQIEPNPEPSKAPPLTPPISLEPVSQPVTSREKQEFLLTNGERILGRILSETTDALYINHETLGVLTIQRTQIAKRLIEIILINGDRIVGDVIAETPECLYVRHASLGMLTVPHTQRSARVVEAILKDGDRILGEVLAETENFTVIRSATLGTVAVQHTQVAMLNRKSEQIQLKALPPVAPTIENKPTP